MSRTRAANQEGRGRTPEGRLYVAIVSTLGFGLLTAGLALNILTISATVGPFQMLPDASRARAGGVGLWLPPSAGEAQNRLDVWRDVLGDSWEVQSAHSLAELEAEDVRAVVVVAAERLHAGEARRLLALAEDGIGILLAGPVGGARSTPRVERTALLSEILGVGGVAVLAPEAVGHLVATPGSSLTVDLAPGQSLPVSEAEARWGIPAPSGADLEWERHGKMPYAAAHRRELPHGRIAWLAIQPDGSDAPHRNALLHAQIDWLIQEPRLEILAGPPDASALLDTRVRRVGARRLLVEVTHRGDRAFSDLVLRVHANVRMQEVRAERTLLQHRTPEVSFVSGDSDLELTLPELHPGTSRAYTVDFIEVTGRGA